MNITIRKAEAKDADPIVKLTEELGYKITGKEVIINLKNLFGSPSVGFCC